MDSRGQYPVGSPDELRKFLDGYLPRVFHEAQTYDLDLMDGTFTGDHLGLQVVSAEEFDRTDASLRMFTDVARDESIHGRRNRVYRFREPIVAQSIAIPGIEIFEPKPGADRSTLRPGIEHIAFVVRSLDTLLREKGSRLSVAKDATYSVGRFVKTAESNGVEIEFRESPLIPPITR